MNDKSKDSAFNRFIMEDDDLDGIVIGEDSILEILNQVKQDIESDSVTEQTISTLKRVYEELESKL